MSGARPWLRSLRKPLGHLVVGGDQHAALAGRHLLVGVEGEGWRGCRGADRAGPPRRRRRAPGRRPRASACSHRVGERARGRAGRPGSRRCAPAGSPRCARRRPPRRCGRVDVERDRVDVAEDRRRALVEQAVGRGDEAERGRQHLVALAPPEARGPPRCRPAVPLETATASSTPSQLGERRARTRSASGPSESRPERSTSRTSSSSRAPRSGRASGICSCSRAACLRSGRVAGRRTRASRPAPPRRPR